MTDKTTILNFFNGLDDSILPGTVQPELLKEHYFWQTNQLDFNTSEPGPAAKLPFTRYILFGGPVVRRSPRLMVRSARVSIRKTGSR